MDLLPLTTALNLSNLKWRWIGFATFEGSKHSERRKDTPWDTRGGPMHSTELYGVGDG
jgi:hypothetical protein